MCCSQAIMFKDNPRVFQMAMEYNKEDGVLYCDDKIVGYIKYKNKKRFIIHFEQDGFVWETQVKYSDVTEFGEKHPYESTRAIECEKAASKHVILKTY